MKVSFKILDPLPSFERCVRFEFRGIAGVICVHNTTMGPALGGMRVKKFGSETEMLIDCARLARGMSYKNAASNFAFGGGKAVINADPKKLDADFLREYGEVVEALHGKYITAPDYGSNPEMMGVIAESTNFVVCLTENKGGLGDPSPSTARGVYLSLLSILPQIFKVKKLEGLKVVVQGYGNVGRPLALMLAEDKAQVFVSEVKNERLADLQDDNELGWDLTLISDPNQVYQTKADVFCPNAIGGIVNAETIPLLAKNFKLICGGANNQLGNTAHDSKLLKKARLWYAPDFIVNAGGVARACVEWQMRSGDINRGEVDDRLETYLRNIGKRLRKVFEKAEGRGLTTVEAARQLAEETVADKGGQLR